MSERLPQASNHARDPLPDLEKVAGKTRFAADISLPKMLCGAVLRSPFAHARILRLDIARALQMEGVHAIVTAADLPDWNDRQMSTSGSGVNIRDLSLNVMAHTKALYEGHALAAVAARDMETARKALTAIDVEFAVLPHVIDVRQAMEPEAPLLHEQLVSRGMAAATASASNIASRHEDGKGDIEGGFAEADVLAGEEFMTAPVHQGFLELPACLAQWTTPEQVQLWSSSAHPSRLQSYCADVLELPRTSIQVQPTTVDPARDDGASLGLEPLAILLARKSGRPVKMQMPRDDVFRATAPVSGSYTSMRIGARHDGTLLAAQGILCYQAGAFPGSPVWLACQSAFAGYAVPHVRVIGYDVVSNRGKSSSSWQAGATMAAFATESLLDVLAGKLDLDPLELRLKNISHPADDATQPQHDLAALLQAAQRHAHYRASLAAHQGRGVAFAAGINGEGTIGAGGAVHICDVEVDPETGQVTLLRYTAIHSQGVTAPASAVQARMQGEIARGVGWALNEAYLYDDEGRLLNPNFLDYRMPVASDLPMIEVLAAIEMCATADAAVARTDPVDVEHMLSLAIVPSLAAVSNAVARAVGARSFELPLTPPVVLKLVKAAARRRRR